MLIPQAPNRMMYEAELDREYQQWSELEDMFNAINQFAVTHGIVPLRAVRGACDAD